MNPTGKNIASDKSWKGRKSPWLGTKNIWKLFNKVDLLSDSTYNKILEKKPKDWDYDFCDFVYEEIEKNKIFITNLGKCTQIDARPLPDNVLKQYLNLLLEEIDIIKPKVIVTFGNQVSSIIINKKISVSENRKKYHDLKIKDNIYKVFPVYYPVGNGIFNIDKSIEDIKWIISNVK
jgi:DNA polymerase